MSDPQILLQRAETCRRQGDDHGEEAAVDALLAAAPGNLRGLLAKGAVRARAGDDRGATSFYKTALGIAAAQQPLPRDLMPGLQEAQAAIRAASARYEAHLEATLDAAGFTHANRSQRFQHSLDLMCGRRSGTMGLQQPSAYFFPDLPQRRYYERAEFAWAPAVEAEAPAMLPELNAILGSDAAFRPYLVDDPSRPRRGYHGLTDNPAWSTLHLHENGEPVPDIVARAPRTYAALADVPLPRIGVRAPSILFSLLRGGARIPPHSGMLNARLICHLPLIVPPGCGFRVGGEVREWHVGKLTVFDDSVEHEAWNDGPDDRVVLIFDIWRPELTHDERDAITTMFGAIDSYGKAAA